jgi:hypothetical protein
MFLQNLEVKRPRGGIMKRVRIIMLVMVLVSLLVPQWSFAFPTTLMAKKLLDLRQLREQVARLRNDISSVVEPSELKNDVNAFVAIRGIERVELYLREVETSAVVFGYVMDKCKSAYFTIKIFPLPNSEEYLDSQMESIEKGFEIAEASELVPLINKARVIVESSKKLCREMIELLEHSVMDYKEVVQGDCSLSY